MQAPTIDEYRCPIGLEVAMKHMDQVKAMRFWLAIVVAALIVYRISVAANP